LKYWIFFLVKY